jgi:crossover junction endodeoxyribonuclease RusA
MNKPDPIKAALAKQWPRQEAERVDIDLPLPISTNDLHAVSWRSFRNSDRYRTWSRAAGVMINAQRPASVRGHYALTLVINPRRTKIDLDNSIKGISDLLQAHRVIENDRLANRIVLEWPEAVEGSRVTIEKWGAAA